MAISSMEQFNILQQRVLANDNVSDDEIAEAVEYLRRFRKTELPSRSAAKAPKAPKNLDNLLNDLGL